MGDIYQSVREHTIKIFAAIAQMMRRQRVEQREMLFALHSFTPARGNTDQLAFVEGDEFILRSDADTKWWHVKHSSGRKGYVPMSYVARRSEKAHLEWYDMRLSRGDAERILEKEKYEPGSFIIRTKEDRHFSHALALTVKTKGDDEQKIIHYVITREGGQFKIEGGKPFSSLTQLVRHYAGHGSSLKLPLTFSVKKDMPIEVWEIGLSEITKGELLGSGWFGKVYKGTFSGDDVAVKTVNLERMSVLEFMREAEIARKFSHKNIVKVIGVCSVDKEPLIVTEYLRGGSLKEYLKNNPLLSVKTFLPIAQKISKPSRRTRSSIYYTFEIVKLSSVPQIACAMAHMEERGFVHRDLAARNILVGDDLNTIKLADFGLARCLGDSKYYKTDKKAFPIKWTAPEAFVMEGDSVNESQEGKITVASDVWSFAVVLWELYSRGAEPYEGLNSRQIYRKLTDEIYYRLPCPSGCAPVIYQKMEECWSLEPQDRPTFAELKTFLLNPYGDAQ